MNTGRHSGLLSSFSEQLRQDLGYCLLFAYLLAFMQPTLLHCWHAAAHIYAVAESEVAHEAADHVHAYNTHEHGDVMDTMLRMLLNGESMPLNETSVIKTVSLQLHIPFQSEDCPANAGKYTYKRPVSDHELTEYKKRPFIPPPQVV